MVTKAVVFSIMLSILIALASGLVFLIRDEGKTPRAVKALTWRISLSLFLFLFLFLAFSLGWLKPHGL